MKIGPIHVWRWLKTWAKGLWAWDPDDQEPSQLETTREILSREIELAKSFAGYTDGITADGPLGFAAFYERQAGLELCGLVKGRATDIAHRFMAADSQGWSESARAEFWKLEDEFDPTILDSAIGGLRSMADAMRLEATR